MITCKLALLAEGISVDVGTRNATAFNILDELAAAAFPVFIPKLSFFAILHRDANDPVTTACSVRIQLNEAVLLQQDLTLQFEEKLRTRLAIGLQGLVVPTAGSLGFEIRAGETVLAAYYIPVTQQAQQLDLPPQAAVQR